MAKHSRSNSAVSEMTVADQERNEIPLMPQESPEQPIISEQTDNATTGISTRKGRGLTAGLSVQKKRRWTEKLDIVIHRRRNRIVGPNSMDFKTEACVVIKQHAPLQYAFWKDIPLDSKRKMWLGMKQKFNLEEDIQAKKIVFQQLNRQYRSYRHKLHLHYLKMMRKYKDNLTVLDKSPSGVSREDWKMLINYFESEDFKKVSDRNKLNRQKLNMRHACGTKSIAQSCYEDRDPETGEEPTRTAAWKKTRYNSKKKKWVDEASREVYEELLRLQSEPTDDGHDPMSEDEAFVKVLWKEKPNRLRACGDGLKPPSKRGERINLELQKENEDLKKKNEEMASRLDSLEAQVSNQEGHIQAQVEALLKAKLPTILQSLSQTSQFPLSDV